MDVIAVDAGGTKPPSNVLMFSRTISFLTMGSKEVSFSGVRNPASVVRALSLHFLSFIHRQQQLMVVNMDL